MVQVSLEPCLAAEVSPRAGYTWDESRPGRLARRCHRRSQATAASELSRSVNRRPFRDDTDLPRQDLGTYQEDGRSLSSMAEHRVPS